MKDEKNTHEQQLDHATARIVAELAAALLPHLKETVTTELVSAAKSLPINVNRDVEEALSALKRLQTCLDGMAEALNSSHVSTARLTEDLLALPRACEALNKTEPGTKPNEELLHELLRSMETGLRSLETSLKSSFSDWEGVLRADGRAQTKELTGLSAEVSEQMSWMQSNLHIIMEKALSKALLAQRERGEAADGSVGALEGRLAGIEKTVKIILVQGVIFAFLAFLTTFAVLLLLFYL